MNYSKYLNYLIRNFSRFERGSIKISLPNDQQLNFSGNNQGVECEVSIYNWQAIKLVIERGDIGLGEAYHLGWIDSVDLPKFLTYCSENINWIDNKANSRWLSKIKFLIYNNIVRLNTKHGSKKNIKQHYDVGNDFYQLWLDPSMTYSSALRTNQEQNLAAAQQAKYQRILSRLNLAGYKTLEIGCGWGGFLNLAQQFTDDITGITISNQQYDYIRSRLSPKIPILLQDYRDLQGKYERLVSIEMFEAVGAKYWQVYFDKIKQILVRGGKALIQTITINDQVYSNYKNNSDYIRHYIFPGGMLPSKSIFFKHVQQAKLEVLDVLEFGLDYAWTLGQWLENFKLAKKQLQSLNYSELFLRSWEFYLSICIAGFLTGRTNVMQVELVNPN